jgi:hypothetical protein
MEKLRTPLITMRDLAALVMKNALQKLASSHIVEQQDLDSLKDQVSFLLSTTTVLWIDKVAARPIMETSVLRLKIVPTQQVRWAWEIL